MGKTSWEVKQRYNQKVYTRIVAEIPKELATQFKEKCKQNSVSQASVLKEAIEKFLNNEL